MNYQAKITPTGTDLLKAKGPNTVKQVTDRPVSPTIHPDDALPGGIMPPPATPVATPPDIARAIEAQTQPLQVCLMGTAPSSRMLAPFHDPAWKIWSCSPGNMNIFPRVDAWFELHANLLWPECVSYGAPYIEWLKQQKFPIYMQNRDLVPNAIPFPKDEMVAKFGRYFFTSSFAWMMAFAITQGAKKIALYGVDMASKDEYILQRAGGYYFMQIAHMHGCEVMIPYESDLLQPPPLYGYSEVTPIGRKLHVRAQEIKERVNHMRAERDKLTHNVTYLEGALEDLDYMLSIWGGAQS